MAYIDPYEEEQERRAELELDAQLRRQGMPDPEIRRPSAMSPYAEPAPPSAAPEPLSVPMGEAAPALVALAQSMEREASAPTLASGSARDVSGRMHTGLTPEQAAGMRAGYDAIATPRERSALPEQAPPPPQNALEAFAAQGLVGPASGTRLSPGQRMALASRPTPEMQREQALKALASKRAFEIQKIQAAHPVKPPSELDAARSLEAQARAAKLQAETDRLNRRGRGGAPSLSPMTGEGVEAQVQGLVESGVDPQAVAGLAAAAKMPGKRGQKARDKLLSMYTSVLNREDRQAASDELREAKRQLKDSEQDAKQRVVGWERTPEAPLMADAEMKSIREEQFAVRDMERINKEIQQLASQITPEDMAAAKLGKDTPAVAKARQLQRSLTTALRIAANMGVPSAQEMLIVNQQAPPLEAIEGYLNARPRYNAIAEDFRSRFDVLMDARGYRKAAAKGGGKMPSTDGQRTYKYRIVTPGGVTTQELTTDQAQHIHKKWKGKEGFAVEAI